MELNDPIKLKIDIPNQFSFDSLATANSHSNVFSNSNFISTENYLNSTEFNSSLRNTHNYALNNFNFNAQQQLKNSKPENINSDFFINDEEFNILKTNSYNNFNNNLDFKANHIPPKYAQQEILINNNKANDFNIPQISTLDLLNYIDTNSEINKNFNLQTNQNLIIDESNLNRSSILINFASNNNQNNFQYPYSINQHCKLAFNNNNNIENDLHQINFNQNLNFNDHNENNFFPLSNNNNNINNMNKNYFNDIYKNQNDNDFFFLEDPNQSSNFKPITTKIENFFYEFLSELDSSEKSTPSIGILDLDKVATFSFEHGYFALPENTSELKFTTLTLQKNLDRITKILNILSILYEKMMQNSKTTKRELYYNDVELFKDAGRIDSVLQDICSILNVNRFDLKVFPAQKGLFAGVLEVLDSQGNLLAFNSATNFDKINLITQNFFCDFSVKTEATCILIVEKETIFHNIISHEGFKSSFAARFLVITGKGYPDYLTKFFLKRLTLLKPQMGLFYFGDLDAYGLEIYLNYVFGSRKSARENYLLCVSNVYWLGLTYEIIDFYLGSCLQGILDARSLVMLTPQDYRKIECMVNEDAKEYFCVEKWACSGNKHEDFIVANIMRIRDQLDLMVLKGYRAEAELITSKNMEILIDLILRSESEFFVE